MYIYYFKNESSDTFVGGYTDEDMPCGDFRRYNFEDIIQ